MMMPVERNSPDVRGFPNAPERTRTSTDHKVHKALNLARLPIPPQAREAASIAPDGSPNRCSAGAGRGENLAVSRGGVAPGVGS
jgi:hypothetical protein